MTILVLLGVLLFVFIISRASGDPVVAVLGENYTQEQYQATYVSLGLDKPYVVQYFEYLKGIVTKLDLGTSYQSKLPVAYEVFTRFPVSVRLSINAIIWAVPLGIFFGVVSAIKQYSPLDYTVRTVSMIMGSMPGFWVAMMLMLIVSLKLKLVPATGLNDWRGYILPAITMGLHPVTFICRMTRSTMLEVIRQDYIRTARSKGLSQMKVIMSHAFRNAAVPIVAQIGGLVAVTCGGSAVIENIFNIPGLGSFLIYSIGANDYPCVQGAVVAYSLFVCIVNFAVDLIYGFIDPRIKASYMSVSSRTRKENKNVDKEARRAAS